MAQLPKPRIILDIVEQHFEELDFLWEQRESVIFAPDWTLDELAELEERATAHLDGLRIAQGHAADLVRPALTGEERGVATAAAMTLMALDSPELETEVVESLATAGGDARDGIRIALRHSDITRIARRLQELAAQGDLEVRAAAVDVLAFHRQPPPAGLLELAFQAGPRIRSLIDAALGRFGGPWSADGAQSDLTGSDYPGGRSALETSAVLGIPNLAQVCRQAAGRPQDPSPAGLAFLGVLGNAEDLPLLESSLGRAGLARAALDGLGALGRIAAIPRLIESMRNPDLAVTAGAAFARITGADGFEAETPLPPPEGLSQEELEFHDPVVPPDPVKAGAWWEREKGRFSAEGRWQVGLEVSQQPLGAVLNRLPLQYRRDVYLAARAKDPARTHDINLEARAVVQRAMVQR